MRYRISFTGRIQKLSHRSEEQLQEGENPAPLPVKCLVLCRKREQARRMHEHGVFKSR
jgi:hypothetical protein